MKNLLTIAAIFLALTSFAQTPQFFNYQGVARDADNKVITDSEISLRFSILEDFDNGLEVYTESHLVQTSSSGVFSLKIGEGQNVTGQLDLISWGSKRHFLQIELDVEGGSNFEIIGASQLVSVPYAMHAQTVSDKDDADADPSNEIQSLGFDVATNKLTLSDGGEVDLSSLDNDDGGGGTGTDDQVISFSGDILSIEDGNSVDLSGLRDGVDDADADPNNEIQTLSLQGKTLSISQSNSTVDLSGLEGHWKQVDNTEVIEYSGTNPWARVTDGSKSITISSESVDFADDTDCKTYMVNGGLYMNEETKISDDLYLIKYASGMNKDSIYFFDYTSDGDESLNSTLSKGKLEFTDELSNQKWTGHLDAVQLDMRENDDEAWGNYDAYGFTAITSDQSPEGQSELDVKASLGMYVSKPENNINNATLYNEKGVSMGTGFGAGLMDEVHTTLDKHLLNFESYVEGGLATGRSIYGRDYMLQDFTAGAQTNRNFINPFGISYENIVGESNNRMDLTDASLEFLDPNFGYRWTHLGRDSLTLSGNIGLLFPETATLKRSHLYFETIDFRSMMSSTEFNIKQALNDTDIFDRVKIIPDDLSMYNDTKWQTVKLGTNMDNKQGELTLFGNGAVPHTYIGGLDLGGAVMEMSYGMSPRVGAWAFEDYGVINTSGKNGNQNTFVGTAHLHDEPNYGGLGVMDDLGLVQAGMEVDEWGFGNVYADGSFRILNSDDVPVSYSDWWGYTLNRADGTNILKHGYDFLQAEQTGYYSASGENAELNFFSGENANHDGGHNYGYIGVFDNTGTEKAGMYATSGGRGFAFADGLYIGEMPDNNSPFPIKMIQQPSYGFDIMRSDLAVDWEFFISTTDNLNLYKNNSALGFFHATTGAYTTFSDRRLKSNIRTMKPLLTKVNTLVPSKYAYIKNNPNQIESIGFIAQDVQELFPELVSTHIDKDGSEKLAIDYAGFGVIAIKAIQEQQVVIDQQANEIDDLKKRLERIEKLLEK